MPAASNAGLLPLAEQIRPGQPLAELFRSAAYLTRQRAESLFGRCATIHEVKESLVESRQLLEEGHAQSPSSGARKCEAGCCACCLSVSVDATPLEALIIADYLAQTSDCDRLTHLKSRLGRAAELRREAFCRGAARRVACAMLSPQGLCTVYPVRPMACAGFFSLSRVACEAAYHVGDLTAAEVPTDRAAKAWTMGVSGGLQHALVAAGLDANLYELNAAVLCALETPRAVDRWLAGEDVFAGCLCTDAHSPPRSAKSAA